MTPFAADPAEPTRADLLAQLATLQGKFANLAAIEQAKGALMVTYGLTADAAFDLLRFHSQSRNVKLRAIAAELAALLSTSPTSAAAITRFDRLLDGVASGLQTPAGPKADAPAPGPPGDLAALLSQIVPDQDQQGTRPVVPPPGVTIAGNIPGLPLVYANDAFTELTGYPTDYVLGRNCRFLQGPGTDPKDVLTLSQALHSGHDVTVVMRNYRIDGSVFLNEVSISPIRNPINQITHYIGTQIDVTPRQQGDAHPGTAA